MWCVCVKQKTAYEMRISDWSSDVCSSDLLLAVDELFPGAARQAVEVIDVLRAGHFQRQLGVFQREEARRTGDPVELVVVAVDFLQQVVVDLDRKSTRLNYSH